MLKKLKGTSCPSDLCGK